MGPDLPRDDPPTMRPRCSCGRLARFFGRFAGGVCTEHALSMLDMFPDGMSQFWPEHHQALVRAGTARKESP